MCEANAYIILKDTSEESLVLEAVDQVIPEGVDTWRLTSIFGEQKVISGRIKSMNLVEHRIIFESATT